MKRMEHLIPPWTLRNSLEVARLRLTWRLPDLPEGGDGLEDRRPSRYCTTSTSSNCPAPISGPLITSGLLLLKLASVSSNTCRSWKS